MANKYCTLCWVQTVCFEKLACNFPWKPSFDAQMRPFHGKELYIQFRKKLNCLYLSINHIKTSFQGAFFSIPSHTRGQDNYPFTLLYAVINYKQNSGKN